MSISLISFTSFYAQFFLFKNVIFNRLSICMLKNMLTDQSRASKQINNHLMINHEGFFCAYIRLSSLKLDMQYSWAGAVTELIWLSESSFRGLKTWVFVRVEAQVCMTVSMCISSWRGKTTNRLIEGTTSGGVCMLWFFWPVCLQSA